MAEIVKDIDIADVAGFAAAEPAIDILNDVGVPYCRGGVMATNADWRHSTEGWKEVV
ncbi:MAG: DUF294 nucleotidyltransferase-like domain-containing protein, partial [Pseudomonadota bacterium]